MHITAVNGNVHIPHEKKWANETGLSYTAHLTCRKAAMHVQPMSLLNTVQPVLRDWWVFMPAFMALLQPCLRDND